MSTEFNELLQSPYANQPQIWVVGSREQVNHIINEFYVKRVITDRNQFSPKRYLKLLDSPKIKKH